MSERLWHLLSGKLDEIAAFYKVRPRITLIVRVPGKPKECAFLSDDNWTDAVETVRQLQGDPSAFKAGPQEPRPALPAPPAPDAVESIVVLTPAHGVAPITITRSAGGLHTAALPAPDAVRVAAEHHVGACTEANGGKLCARCFAALDPLAARDGGGE